MRVDGPRREERTDAGHENSNSKTDVESPNKAALGNPDAARFYDSCNLHIKGHITELRCRRRTGGSQRSRSRTSVCSGSDGRDDSPTRHHCLSSRGVIPLGHKRLHDAAHGKRTRVGAVMNQVKKAFDRPGSKWPFRCCRNGYPFWRFRKAGKWEKGA